MRSWFGILRKLVAVVFQMRLERCRLNQIICFSGIAISFEFNLHVNGWQYNVCRI